MCQLTTCIIHFNMLISVYSLYNYSVQLSVLDVDILLPFKAGGWDTWQIQIQAFFPVHLKTADMRLMINIFCLCYDIISVLTHKTNLNTHFTTDYSSLIYIVYTWPLIIGFKTSSIITKKQVAQTSPIFQTIAP